MKTHFKKTIDPNFIGTYILPEGNSILVKIISIKYENAKVQGKSSKRVIATFAKNKHFNKPMILNITNMRRIAKLTGSSYIEDWEVLDLDVTLQQEMDKAFGGGQDWALRIGKDKPKPKVLPELLQNTESWANVLKALMGDFSMDQVKTKFRISEENESELLLILSENENT